jgi:hypothetical protein
MVHFVNFSILLFIQFVTKYFSHCSLPKHPPVCVLPSDRVSHSYATKGEIYSFMKRKRWVFRRCKFACVRDGWNKSTRVIFFKFAWIFFLWLRFSSVMLKWRWKSSLCKRMELKYNAEVKTVNRIMWRGDQRCHVWKSRPLLASVPIH